MGRSSIGGKASGSYARSRIVRPIAAVMTCTSHPSITTPCSPRSLIPPAIQPTSNPVVPSRKFSVGRRQFGQSAIHPSLLRRQGSTPDRRAANSAALIAVVALNSRHFRLHNSDPRGRASHRSYTYTSCRSARSVPCATRSPCIHSTPAAASNTSPTNSNGGVVPRITIPMKSTNSPNGCRHRDDPLRSTWTAGDRSVGRRQRPMWSTNVGNEDAAS